MRFSPSTLVGSITDLVHLILTHIPDKSDRATASLVNSLWREVAQSLLLKDVRLECSVDTHRKLDYDTIAWGGYHPCRNDLSAQCLYLTAFIGRLAENDSHRGAWIRTLRTDFIASGLLKDLLACCTQLRSLDILHYEDDTASVLRQGRAFDSCASTLVELTIRQQYGSGEDARQCDDYWHAVLPLRHVTTLNLIWYQLGVPKAILKRLGPTLTSLHLGGADDYGLREEYHVWWLQDDLRACFRCLERIEHLSMVGMLSGNESVDFDTLPHASIRTLKCRGSVIVEYLDTLERLADPSWMPLLEKIPMLICEEIGYSMQEHCEVIGRERPTILEAEDLLERCLAGLRQREHIVWTKEAVDKLLYIMWSFVPLDDWETRHLLYDAEEAGCKVEPWE